MPAICDADVSRKFMCHRFVTCGGDEFDFGRSLTDSLPYLRTVFTQFRLGLFYLGIIMAAFSVAFNRTMKNEGGYVLHEVVGDRGGMTFAGIARKYNSSWAGWSLVDAGDRDSAALKKSVAEFYFNNYFNACGLKNIKSQAVANVVYDFAVNAGVRTAVHLVQQSVGVVADGIVGARTLAAINTVGSDEFIARYALAKVARYAAIVNRDRSQGKFLLGWINRTLRDLESL